MLKIVELINFIKSEVMKVSVKLIQIRNFMEVIIIIKVAKVMKIELKHLNNPNTMCLEIVE